MRMFRIIFLAVLVTATRGSSLLEMSQQMWSKLLEGGLTKIGALDPLIVPIVKVDQSEGNTSYRIILRGLEIVGLNSSNLESVHIARGRLKTNLSEHEAGYVSYTDQRELDTIRYRFHTVTKESKNAESQNRRVQPVETFDYSIGREKDRERVENDDSSRDRYDNEGSRFVPRGPRPLSKYDDDRTREENRSNYRSSIITNEQSRYQGQSENSRINSHDLETNRREFEGQDRGNVKNSERVRIVYPERQRQPIIGNYRTTSQRTTVNDGTMRDCSGSCEYGRTRGYSTVRENPANAERSNEGRRGDGGFSASMDFDRRQAYVKFGDNQERRNYSSRKQNGGVDAIDNGANFEGKHYETNDQRDYGKNEEEGLENKAGYVDIVYADDKDRKMRRFGNLKVESGRDTTVYSFDDVMRDLRDNKRFIIHNFTEGEALTKKNDAVRTASETKRIKDLIRYAREFQEMQGYYEQGMQLIYHYGKRDDEKDVAVGDVKRTKREHVDDKTEEEDIMHVIMRIRVPMLRINAGYVLMGKVGKQVLRGNGLFAGNFTDVIGDFTLELKKLDEDTMVVRAARARLSAKHKNIALQGMDEEGPVKEILTQGLMAAEAVAAMLADDLATKALSEKTADSIVYRMYNNLPTKN